MPAAPVHRDLIVEKVRTALAEARDAGVLNLETLPDIAVERPANPENGDFATSLPLRLAKSHRVNPLKIAEEIASRIDTGREVKEVWAAPPGFVNFRLDDAWLISQIESILQDGNDYGKCTVGQGRKVLIEFVSVNPTGPVHVGHTRGAVLGSSLASVMEAAGYDLTTEYYVNDAGSQMENFYASVLSRYEEVLGKDSEFPANGYRGDYVRDLAQEIVDEHGDSFLSMPRDDALRQIGAISREKMIALIKDDLEQIGVRFDNWFSEGTLFDGGEYDAVMELLKDGGHVVEREGAQWFNSTALGEDKDNVLVRSTGAPTYFASDIAYHHNKFQGRGFDQCINIWGADHQGHVPRVKAAVSALGVEPERLTVMISQMVTLKRGSEVVRASKRTGDFVTLRELVEEVGADACRYFFLARTPSTQMEFDLELAKKESVDNPVYYVQYGYARIAGILRNAVEQGIDWSGGDVSLLTHESELALVRKMTHLPELVETMARNLEPHHLTYYATELATAFHWFYDNCRVLSSDPADRELTLARLKLVDAARTVLSRTLALMGMQTPDRM